SRIQSQRDSFSGMVCLAALYSNSENKHGRRIITPGGLRVRPADQDQLGNRGVSRTVDIGSAVLRVALRRTGRRSCEHIRSHAMSRRITAWRLLARIISTGNDPESVSLLRQEMQVQWRIWPHVIRFADTHFMTPALWANLKRKGLLEYLPREP